MANNNGNNGNNNSNRPPVQVQVRQHTPPAPAAPVTENPHSVGARETDAPPVVVDDAGPVEVEEHQITEGARIQFQSDQARESAMSALKGSPRNQPLSSARIGKSVEERQVVVRRSGDDHKLVKVRPKVTQPRFCIGGEWYGIQAGKECLVPKHVALILEQRDYV